MMGSWEMAERFPQGCYISVGFAFSLTYCLKSQQILFLFQCVIWRPCLQKQDSGTPLLPDFRNWIIRLESQGTQHICDWLQILVVESMMVHRPPRPLDIQGGKMARKQKKGRQWGAQPYFHLMRICLEHQGQELSLCLILLNATPFTCCPFRNQNSSQKHLIR